MFVYICTYVLAYKLIKCEHRRSNTNSAEALVPLSQVTFIEKCDMNVKHWQEQYIKTTSVQSVRGGSYYNFIYRCLQLTYTYL